MFPLRLYIICSLVGNQLCTSFIIFLQYNNISWHWHVSETARQVASFPMSSKPIPYDQMKNEYEALVTGKQQKMLALRSFKLQQAAGENERKNMVRMPLYELSRIKTNICTIDISCSYSCPIFVRLGNRISFIGCPCKIWITIVS